MKARHAEWAKLGASRTPGQAHPMIRMLALPGFRTLEDKLLIYSRHRGAIPPDVEQAANELSLQTFGITQADTEFEWPEECEEFSEEWERTQKQYERYECRFETTNLSEEDTVVSLKRLGFDFSDDRGIPLRCTKLFNRQAEAAAKGFKGRMPDRTSIGIEQWENNLQAAARAFIEKRPR